MYANMHANMYANSMQSSSQFTTPNVGEPTAKCAACKDVVFVLQVPTHALLQADTCL